MNFVKRAGRSLRARKSKTAVVLGIFVVISTLLLGGFLLQEAAARQEADAQRVIGVDATVKGKGLTPGLADRLGASPSVSRYNSVLPLSVGARGFKPLQSGQPRPGGEPSTESSGKGPLALNGVRDCGMLLPFSYGSNRITSGRGIAPEDVGRKVATIEQRLAEKNGLKVGGTIGVRSADGRRTVQVKIIGIYEDAMPDPLQWQRPSELPGNTVYVPVSVARELSPGTKQLSEAVFKIGSPELAQQLHAAAKKLFGAESFDFLVNDKAYKDQVRPIQQVGGFAGLIVWLIALAGALILALIVTLQIRERRDELGMLLAMGEKKWKLITQHTVEVAAVAGPAVLLAAVAGQLAAPHVADALPGGQVGTLQMTVGLADLGKVTAIALGISVVATALPGIGILRLHPRSLLALGE
ncbi:ABC transporter permease [Streptomyces sp. PSAA01]|uniref:ABC transporter permease n=1 Tax=Streptomyces sp. PSAA01 TaxID=2912762 RepID=UPI001F1BD44D|nr:ABC transporter permease [Streptomyces sp. PSAA01]MCG0289028.1 ABC transporter permease [Streptomyces sp. PSAA01]